VDGVRCGGSSAVVSSGNPGNPPSWMLGTSVGLSTQPLVEMWGLWLGLDCLDDEAIAAGVLICSDNH
jgi:hypothetical protein